MHPSNSAGMSSMRPPDYASLQPNPLGNTRGGPGFSLGTGGGPGPRPGFSASMAQGGMIPRPQPTMNFNGMPQYGVGIGNAYLGQAAQPGLTQFGPMASPYPAQPVMGQYMAVGPMGAAMPVQQPGLVPGGQQFVAMAPAGTGQQFMVPSIRANVGGQVGAFGGFVGGVQPPQYAAHMGMNYRHAQPVQPVAQQPAGSEPTEEERRRAAKELKQRQFADQQRRLAEFSAVGGKTMNADALIESILGSRADSRPGGASGGAGGAVGASGGGMEETQQGSGRPQQPQQNSAGLISAQINADAEDDFGDFFGVPAATVVPGQSATLAPVAMTVAPPSKPLLTNQNSADAPSISASSRPTEKVVERQDKKKDLLAMMADCSDLSADRQARGFVRKTAVNQLPAARPSATPVTYADSKTACHWSAGGDSSELSQLFTLPVPVGGTLVEEAPLADVNHSQARPEGAVPVRPGGGATVTEFKLPHWVTGELPAPALYQDVLKAVTREGRLETELVYPVLLESGLPKEALGYIWDLCNRATPGVLSREELFLVLAMVSIAQNRMDYSSLAILSRCPQAPLPNLGHFPSPPRTTDHHPPPSHHPTQVLNPPAYSDLQQLAASRLPANQQLLSGHLGQVAMQGINGSEEDDFADFQSAAGGAAVGGGGLSGWGGGGHVQWGANGGGDTMNNLGGTAGGDLLAPEDKYSVLRDVTTSFQNPATTAVVPPEAHSDSLPSFTPSQPPLSSSLDSDQFSTFQSNTSTITSTSANQKQGAPGLADTKPWLGDTGLRFGTGKGFDIGARSATSGSNEMGEFEFGEFSQPAKPASDKYTALKEPGGGELFLALEGKLDGMTSLGGLVNKEGGWAEFQTQGLKSSGAGEVDHGGKGFSDNLMPAMSINNLGSGLVPQSGLTSSAGTSLNNGTVFMDAEKQRVEPKESKINLSGVGVKPAYKGPSYFGGQDQRPGPPVGLGISPLDFHPPDLPDDDFDDFSSYSPASNLPHAGGGVFIGVLGGRGDAVSGGGISSLAGGLDDDFYDPTSPDAKNKNKNSLDITGWRRGNSKSSQGGVVIDSEGEGGDPQDDTQSSNSLDLRGGSRGGAKGGVPTTGGGAREDSPQDSMSVSSNEFPTVAMGTQGGAWLKSPADEMSVASLELKADPDVGSIGGGDRAMKGGGGGRGLQSPDGILSFYEPARGWDRQPLDARDVMDPSGVGNFVDRYRGLNSSGVQDGERHAYEWTRCLQQCLDLLVGSARLLQRADAPVRVEVLRTEHAASHITGLSEVFYVARRIAEQMKLVAISTTQLVDLVRAIDATWADLSSLLRATEHPLFLLCLREQPSCADMESHLSSLFLRADDESSKDHACGLCLLSVEAPSQPTPTSPRGGGDTTRRSWGAEEGRKGGFNDHKLAYGGRQYHASCANLWINCVDLTLPTLSIPELL